MLKIRIFYNEIIDKIKESFENEIDLYNCDLILVPKIINLDIGKKEEEKKKYQIIRKKEKAIFSAFINGIKRKNIYFYKDKNDNKKNFITGLNSLRNFIKENVMN